MPNCGANDQPNAETEAKAEEIGQPSPWATTKKAAAAAGRTLALLLLVTDAQHCVHEKRVLAPRIAALRITDAETVIVVSSGDDVACALAHIGAPEKDVSFVVVSPHAKDRKAACAHLVRRWGANCADCLAVPSAYCLFSFRHTCGRRLGESCAACPKATYALEVDV